MWIVSSFLCCHKHKSSLVLNNIAYYNMKFYNTYLLLSKLNHFLLTCMEYGKLMQYYIYHNVCNIIGVELASRM